MLALSLLLLTAPASADGGWALWEESNDLETFQRIATRRPRDGYTHTSITYIFTYTCLPDTRHPSAQR